MGLFNVIKKSAAKTEPKAPTVAAVIERPKKEGDIALLAADVEDLYAKLFEYCSKRWALVERKAGAKPEDPHRLVEVYFAKRNGEWMTYGFLEAKK